MEVSPSTPAPVERLEVFRLLDLPVEVILLVVEHVDERAHSSSFPLGPPEDLLRLSETCKFFAGCCRPLIWKAISYNPLMPNSARLRATAPYRRSRSMQALNEIVRLSVPAPGHTPLFPPLPLVRLSVTGSDNDPNWMLIRAIQSSNAATEDTALLELVQLLGKSRLHPRPCARTVFASRPPRFSATARR